MAAPTSTRTTFAPPATAPPTAAPPATPTRRSLLAGAAAAAVAGRSLAAATAATAATATSTSASASAIGLTEDAALHLARRATFGPTPALVAGIRSTGTAAWLVQQLAPEGIDDAVMDGLLARYPLLTMSPYELRTAHLPDSWEAMWQLVDATLARAAWSRRQLFEIMVEFWSNHLHVATPSDSVVWTKASEDRDVIRKFALGKFSDLLIADATSPSMLYYLDNAWSSKIQPNQNYARELLELHTVGVGAGYTQTDVEQAALVLSGLSVDFETDRFLYRRDWHYVGPVRVMGWSAANTSASAGMAVIRSYLGYLARHPATANRLAYKLAVRFVSDNPPPALVGALASTYLAGGAAIAPVLRQLFASPEFAASSGQKFRRPLEYAVAAMRTLGVRPPAPAAPGSSRGSGTSTGRCGTPVSHCWAGTRRTATPTWHRPGSQRTAPSPGGTWRSAFRSGGGQG